MFARPGLLSCFPAQLVIHVGHHLALSSCPAWAACKHRPRASSWWRFFLFFYFLFLFFTKIYFRFGNLQEYTPAAGRQGLLWKKIAEKIAQRSLGAGRPAAGRPALAARLQGDRLSHPYIRVGWSPHPSFVSLKFQKPTKKREGGREAKPCRIFEPATAGNQNSSTLYKYIML